MRWRVLGVIGTLYAVQFVPAIFIFMTLPIVLRQEGHSATTIGLIQLVGIPYIFKFLWAPCIDRFAFGREKYKTWIAILSILHVCALAVLAFLEPSGAILPLFIVLFIAITAVCTQDVAVDALAISLLKPAERAIGASFQNFGMYFGAVVGGFGFLSLYELIGWTATLLTLAAIFALALSVLLLVAEPARPAGLPVVGLRSALRFFKRPGTLRWLSIMAAIRFPLVLVSLPIRLMMVDQGMSTEEIALWFGLIAMCGAGGAAILLGPILRKLPRVVALYLVGTVNIAILIAICAVATTLPDTIRFAIVAIWVAVATTDVIVYSAAMDNVRSEMPGFDFSVQVAVFTLLPILSNPVAGAIMDSQGSMTILIGAAALSALPLLILFFWFAPPWKAARSSPADSSHQEDRMICTTSFRTTQTAEVLKSTERHFTEHGITGMTSGPGSLVMEQMGCRVELKAAGDGIDIRVETPTDNFMTFIRDEIVEHLAQVDPDAAAGLRWTGGLRVGELPSNFRILRASKRQEIFPGLIRVTLAGIDVAALDGDGIHIKMMMPETRGRKPVWPVLAENGAIAWPEGEDRLHSRYVTIRSIRPAEREVDIDIAHHDGGLISTWAGLEGDEQEVGIMGPGGDPVLPATENVVLAADYTGLPALARLIESTGGKVTGHLFAAAPSQQALEAYLPPSSLSVTALPLQDFSGKAPELIRTCTDRNVSYAWFAGEFNDAQTIRAIFKGHYGLAKGKQLSVSYWRSGEAGHVSQMV